jgi:hypothetical protein
MTEENVACHSKAKIYNRKEHDEVEQIHENAADCARDKGHPWLKVEPLEQTKNKKDH